MDRHIVVSAFVACLVIATNALSYCQAPLPKYSFPYFRDGSLELKQVAIYHRHGDRSPLNMLPHERNETGVEWNCDQHILYGTDVSGNSDFGINYAVYDNLTNIWATARNSWRGNCFPGQLTKEGASMTYQLGLALRDIYVKQLNFIPEYYDPSAVYFRATGVPRAQQSLFSVLQGMYPPSARKDGASIPFHVVADDYETMVPNTKMCPRLETLRTIAKKQPEWVQVTKKLQPIVDRMVSITGTAKTLLDTPNAAIQWMDILYARLCHGMPLPCSGSNCITEDDVAAIGDASTFMVNSVYGVNASGSGYEPARLIAGPILHELLDFMDKMVNGNKNVPRYLHFSGHDTTIQPLMAALQNNFPEYMPYISQLIIELYQDSSSKEFFVRAMYNNKQLVLPDCWSTICPYTVFKNMIETHYTINDVEKECAGSSNDPYF